MGRRKLYSELSGEAIVHGLYTDNFIPESGMNSPYVKAGNIDIQPEEVVSVFGSEVWVKEAEARRDGKGDTPNRKGIYLGESREIPYGKKIAFIDYNEHTQMWIISGTQHRSNKHVRIVNNNMVLKSRPHEEVSALELEIQLDHSTKTTPVYEINEIHDKRLVNGDVEYKVSWKGYSKHHKTWEPIKNLTDYCSSDMVLDF